MPVETSIETPAKPAQTALQVVEEYDNLLNHQLIRYAPKAIDRGDTFRETYQAMDTRRVYKVLEMLIAARAEGLTLPLPPDSYEQLKRCLELISNWKELATLCQLIEQMRKEFKPDFSRILADGLFKEKLRLAMALAVGADLEQLDEQRHDHSWRSGQHGRSRLMAFFVYPPTVDLRDEVLAGFAENDQLTLTSLALDWWLMARWEREVI